jgi:uncharacterized membrane-anchored protein
MSEDDFPPETKSAGIGIILMLIGSVCGGAVFFYLLYFFYISWHGRR